MKHNKILLVEDQFIEAHDLELILEKNGYDVCGIARSVSQAEEMIARQKPDLVVLDIFLKGSQTGIDLAMKLKQQHIAFIFISANSDRKILDQAKVSEPYGFIVKPFREQDVVTTLEIAFYRKNHSLESRIAQQLTLIREVGEIGNSTLPCPQKFTELAKAFQPYICFDYIDFYPTGDSSNACDAMGLLRLQFEKYRLIETKATDGMANIRPGLYTGQSLASFAHQHPRWMSLIADYGLKSMLRIVIDHDQVKGILSFCSRQHSAYTDNQLQLMSEIEKSLYSVFMATDVKNPGKPAIPEKKKTLSAFADMIGKSTKMLEVFDNIQRVAPSEASVLILGESGTGKEKVARAIHRLSSRNGQQLVVINCASIPENLAESLLFGHEKGAFTNAMDTRIGKFEQANGGTIFLDEIGDMPRELQVKLLRVLQEREIERIGGRNPIPVNVRIIAATNKNLEEEVSAGRFRLDLYYRLHIFPITVPALRERKGDIPELVSYFLAKYSERQLEFTPEALQILKQHHWPGNIRELEHCVQRHILTSRTQSISDVDLPIIPSSGQKIETTSGTKTIHENERDHIVAVLEKCKGKVSGTGGAAEVLDIPPSTLNSRMKKLGIR